MTKSLKQQLITDLERYKNYGTPFTEDMANHIIALLEPVMLSVIGEDENIWVKSVEHLDKNGELVIDRPVKRSWRNGLRKEQRKALQDILEK